MVQRLPDPRLITDSAGAGGTPHMSYSMSGPGSTPVEPSPAPFDIPDPAAVAVAGPTVLVGAGGSDASQPAQGGGWHDFGDSGRDQAGWEQT